MSFPEKEYPYAPRALGDIGSRKILLLSFIAFLSAFFNAISKSDLFFVILSVVFFLAFIFLFVVFGVRKTPKPSTILLSNDSIAFPKPLRRKRNIFYNDIVSVERQTLFSLKALSVTYKGGQYSVFERFFVQSELFEVFIEDLEKRLASVKA